VISLREIIADPKKQDKIWSFLFVQPLGSCPAVTAVNLILACEQVPGQVANAFS
jgi:hypothetical protein